MSGDDGYRQEPGDDVLSGAGEDWEPWESALVGLSIVLGIAGLVGLGWMVNHFILP